MKVWVDDLRPAPAGYSWMKSTNETINFIKRCEYNQRLLEEYGDFWKIEIIDIDHDSGEFVNDGNDYIRVLDWLEETGRNYPIHIHSLNIVGVQNCAQ